MAIYHFQATIISRSTGRSSVAASAYRAGESIRDERTGLTHDYTRKSGIVHSEIMAPEGAPGWTKNRNTLWNAVEIIEKAKNSQVSREINIALPDELTLEQQKKLITDFAKDNFVSKGMVADIAIHDKGDGNPHAHIMLTMRPLTPEGMFGAKGRKEYVLDENGEKIKLKSGEYKSYKVSTTDWDKPETLEKWREGWANYANKALEKAGFNIKIDHRSLEDQGVDRLPQIHVGPHASAMEKKGIQTDRGNKNREIQEINQKLVELKSEKVIVIEKYKTLKEEQEKIEKAEQEDNVEKNIWKHFSEEEKRAVLKAKDLLKTYIDIPIIDQKLKVCRNKDRELDSQLNELTLKERNFKQAASILRELQECREKKEQAGFFSRDNKYLKERIQTLEESFKGFGLGAEDTFTSEYNKFKEHIAERQDQIQVTRNKIENAEIVLQSAKKALINVERKKLIEIYPEHEKAFKNIDFEAARGIQKFNEVMGGRLSLKEMKYISKDSFELRDQYKELKEASEKLKELDEIKKKLQTFEGSIKNTFMRSLDKENNKEYQELKVKEKVIESTLNHSTIKNWDDLNLREEAFITKFNRFPEEIRNMGTSEGINFLCNSFRLVDGALMEIKRQQMEEKRNELFELSKTNQRKTKGKYRGSLGEMEL